MIQFSPMANPLPRLLPECITNTESYDFSASKPMAYVELGRANMMKKTHKTDHTFLKFTSSPPFKYYFVEKTKTEFPMAMVSPFLKICLPILCPFTTVPIGVPLSIRTNLFPSNIISQ